MLERLKALRWSHFFVQGVLHSYAQQLFSNHNALGVLLLLASFTDPEVGLCGLFGVVFSNVLAWSLGLSRTLIGQGIYGLNSMMVCMALGGQYAFSLPLLAVLVMSCMLTLGLTIVLGSLGSRAGIAPMSLPFLVALWIVLLAIRQYESIAPTDDNVFLPNRLYGIGGIELVRLHQYLNDFPLPMIVGTYFKSLGCVIFAPRQLVGFLLAVGLLLSSRIAFTLSVLGFLTGYGYYMWLGANLNELNYSFIGFNFILTSIAVGGFFYVPSWRTYVLALASAPLIGLLIGATSTILGAVQLPVLSLPFVLVVNLILYALSFARAGLFVPVLYQQYAPEKNLYDHVNARRRYEQATWFAFRLPFFGRWEVSQGHEGRLTHLGDWKYAWDFVITGADGKTYEWPGSQVDQYHCYHAPVLAPAAGWVMAVQDGIPDNRVAQVNIKANWGNSLVIKHAEGLYTQLSHLKSGTFRVKPGDYVQAGDCVALLGNSGRSPEPHIHFQVQATPQIGARTLRYPLSQYILHTAEGPELRLFDIPREGWQISNILPLPLLEAAFDWPPGKVLEWWIEERDEKQVWEVRTDAYNHTYWYCHQTGSVAYFHREGALCSFTAFYGSRKALLYHFFVGAQRVLLSYHKQLVLRDELPLHHFQSGLNLWIQDLIAPIWRYLRTTYELHYVGIDHEMRPREVRLESRIRQTFSRSQSAYHIAVGEANAWRFEYRKGKQVWHAHTIV